jgi:anti-sigma regulatory factor (Ser/Thr protein kinase)
MRTRVTTAAEPATDVRFCLVFPRDAISVPVMRHVLGDTLRKLGLAEESVSDLLLAVTEACTNVLQHSGPGRGYEVVAIVGRNRCVLEVVDAGRGFDPMLLPARRAAMRSVSRLRRRRAASPVPSHYPSRAASAGPPTSAMVPAPRSPLSRVRRSAEQRAIARLPESGRGLAVHRVAGQGDRVAQRRAPGPPRDGHAQARRLSRYPSSVKVLSALATGCPCEGIVDDRACRRDHVPRFTRRP